MGYSSVFMKVLFLKQRKGDFQTSLMWNTSWHQKMQSLQGGRTAPGTGVVLELIPLTQRMHPPNPVISVLQNVSLKLQPVFCVIKKKKKNPNSFLLAILRNEILTGLCQSECGLIFWLNTGGCTENIFPWPSCPSIYFCLLLHLLSAVDCTILFRISFSFSLIEIQ